MSETDGMALAREKAAEFRGYLRALPREVLGTEAGKVMQALSDELFPAMFALHERHVEIVAERDKLAAFKAYVHRRLDEAGVPFDPPSPHREAGCRIGGRLDVVLDGARAERDRATKEREEVKRLRQALAAAAREIEAMAADQDAKERDGILEPGPGHHAAVYLRAAARLVRAQICDCATKGIACLHWRELVTRQVTAQEKAP